MPNGEPGESALPVLATGHPQRRMPALNVKTQLGCFGFRGDEEVPLLHHVSFCCLIASEFAVPPR